MEWKQILIEDVVFLLHEVQNDGTHDYDQVSFGYWLANCVGGNGDCDDDVIDLKTFPRPTMYTSFTKSEIIIDGIVNEEAWMKADSITDFYQSQPNPGHLPTERTVVRVLYDKDFLYVSAILYDSEPDKIIIGIKNKIIIKAINYRIIIIII